MNRKEITLRTLTDYFLEKGEIFDKSTYVRQDDIPILPRTVKKVIGNWARIPRMIKVNFPEDYAKIMSEKEEVIETPKEDEVKVVIPTFNMGGFDEE